MYNFSNKLTLHCCKVGIKEKSISDGDISIETSPCSYPNPGSMTLISRRVPFSIIGVRTHPMPVVEIKSTSGIDV